MAGALAGFGLFLWEGAGALRAGAIGFNLDVEGPFSAVLAAVRPELIALLGRVALAYVAGGAALGLCAAVLALVWASGTRWTWRLAFAGELVAVAVLLAWDRAIARPALFDDVAALRGTLAFLVGFGEPWHPRAAALAWVGLHGAVAAVVAARGPRARAGQWLLRTRSPRFLLPGAAVAGAVGIALFVHARPVPSRAPLTVLIGIDAFCPDRLRAYGGTGAIAPNLEAFLADATRFDAAYTPIAQTEPAYRSLLTARWPSATGVRYPLTAEARWAALPTFPASLAAAGWRTSFQTDCSRFNWQGENSGFTVRRQPPRGALNFALEKLRFRALGVFADNAAGTALLPELMANRALAGLYDPYAYARRLVDDLAADAATGPTLFAFHATAAHFPGDPVYPFYRRFVPTSAPLDRRLRMVFSPIGSGGQRAETGWGRAESEALYDELLAEADAQLGIVLEGLRARGLYEEATVVVFSDHGESFHADSPAIAGATPVHGARLSDEENRILLAVKLPQSRQPRPPARVGALVRLIDLGPTVLDLAGVAPLPGADGESLMPLLRGDAAPPRRLCAETGFTHASPDVFDPGHVAGAPRSFDAYRVRQDGVVELGPEAHDAVMREKDFGATDGRSWWVRSPRKDGTVAERCTGACDDPTLPAWLTKEMQ